MMSSLTVFRTALRGSSSVALAARARTAVAVAGGRPLHTGSALGRPYKDDMDRESLKPKPHEYTGSGTDEQTAQNPDAAFNPNKTSPEEERRAAGADGSGQNPLDVSPADHDLAKGGQGKMEDKPQQGSKNRSSGGASAPKAGGGGKGQ